MQFKNLKQDNVLASINKEIAVIRLNRPKTGNPLHPDLVSELVDAVTWAVNDPKIKIIILSGEGRFFCTGLELRDLRFINNLNTFKAGEGFHELNRMLIKTEKILVAAVNGPAAGYGVSILGLFDLVYSVPDAYFFTPFVKWCFAPEGASSVSFPAAIGYHKAAALFLAADRVSADELERAGLISKILQKDKFHEQVFAIAEDITKASWISVVASKRLMKDPIRQSLLDANDRECKILRERQMSGDPQNAVQDFLAQREKKSKNSNESKI